MIMNADSSEGKQGAKSVSPKAKPRTVVVELKDSKLVCAECVTKTPKLHRLCNMVRKRTNEKKICDDVLKRVSKIAGGLEDSFLFCCFSAMKILVIPVNSKVYLAFCKNPLPNERHWKEVADRLEIKLGEIEAAFKEVPAFNNEFITDVLSELSAWNISVDEKIETPLRTLADRYDNFAFDVLAYNVLSRSELPYTPVRTGKLKIDLAWEKKGQDVWTRRHSWASLAVIALACRDKETIPFLLKHFSTGKGSTVPLFVLAKFGKDAQAAVPMLVEQLKKSPTMTTCLALGAFGEVAEEALPALEEVLRTGSGDVRAAAKIAIENIKGK